MVVIQLTREVSLGPINMGGIYETFDSKFKSRLFIVLLSISETIEKMLIFFLSQTKYFAAIFTKTRN